MDNWDLPLVDYWDQRTGAINQHTRRLSQLPDPERRAACNQIHDAVRKRLEGMADELLLKAAVSMVDDLYKYLNDEVLMARALLEYLNAFGRTLTQAVRNRGYVIRYVVDNQFSSVDFLMLGPFDLFPKIFKTAGFVYICPQLLSLHLMKHDGVAVSEYPNAIHRYIAEARAGGDQIVTKCHEESRHYAFIEADYHEGVLDLALQREGRVLSIFRNDAPVAGSEVFVTFPE